MKLSGLFCLISSAFAGTCNFPDKTGVLPEGGCPSTCAIYKRIEEVERLVNEEWTKVKVNFEGSYDKSGEYSSSREILEQLLIRLQKIKKSSMSEAEKFRAYLNEYNNANVPAIIADQEKRTAQLEERRGNLHSQYIQDKTEFIQLTTFCLLNFKEYGEHICDVRSFADGLNL
ncbi:Oidioi.mRNA.OKI2018_I69.PAR.g9937.t1.cds [Oikopleura dioica]|uniref:Oidioi.mRNA.OKI2018_I69.PAR.g9937.t1.cds n=1 Tax=Oikopleura dioica TaxID=34765 RepID=A0ABN7RN00_OIKDI|nr:Oidioi.mRNA.OKI2018_I69.PAR.g9937.t1.cds [Oikopleura dioica]